MNKPIDKERADAHYSGMLAELTGPVAQAEKETCRSCEGAGAAYGEGCTDCNGKGVNWDVTAPAKPVLADLTDDQISKLLQIGDMWMSQDGRDALSDWIHAARGQS